MVASVLESEEEGVPLVRGPTLLVGRLRTAGEDDPRGIADFGQLIICKM